MKQREIKEIMERIFEERKNELEHVNYRSKTRAFAVAGIDLIYNYMRDVLEELNGLLKVENKEE